MNTTRSETTSKWKHPDVPGTSGVCPVKKDKIEEGARSGAVSLDDEVECKANRGLGADQGNGLPESVRSSL